MKDLIKNKLRYMLMENENKRTAAGVLVKCNSTGRILLLLRNDFGDEPNTWSLVSGGIEDGEDVLEGLKSCLLYTSPSPRDRQKSRMPSSA